MAIRNYVNQTVAREARTGFDNYGKPNYSTSENITGRLREKFKRIIDANQKEFQTDAELWTKPDQDLNIEDRITYDGTQYKIVKIDILRKLSGEKNHKKAFLIKTSE